MRFARGISPMKLVVLLLAMCLLPNAWATDMLVMSGAQYNMSATGSEYAGVSGTEEGTRADGWASEFGGTTSRMGLVSTAGTFKNLRVTVSAAPGAGKSYTFTLRKNQADAALTCAISGASATSCADSSNTVSYVGGDSVSMEQTPAGTPTAVQGRFTAMFTPDTANETLLIGGTTSDGNSTTASRDVALHSPGSQSATLTLHQTVLPMSATAKNLYVKLAVAPGAGTTRTFTVQKNGTNTTVTCSISDTATTCSDTANSFTVVAGDTVNLVNAIGAGAPSGGASAVGLTLATTTAGDFGVYGSFDVSTTATVYIEAAVGEGIPTATESSNTVLAQTCTASSLYVTLSGSPGAGKSYAFTLRQDSAATDLTCTVSETGTTCNDSGSAAVANDDLMAYESVPSGTPTGRFVRAGFLCNISAAAARRVFLVN